MTSDTDTGQTPDARAAAVAIIGHLRAQGHEAYLAGGCVRDELLGLVPGDYDVATDATPDRLSSLFFGARLVGAKFGVVQVRKQGVWTEVATFRSDGTYTDKRRPDRVTFSDAQADAERRDFTINALFLDPKAEQESWTRVGERRVAGRVIDLVGGLGDLEAGLLRAVGDPHRRLGEDHLRALRAVRFAARLGFEIEPQTAHAIAEHARELEGISRERIGGELRRMLGHASRSRAASILETLGLDGPALEQPVRGAGHRHPRLASLDEAADFVPALAAWTLDRGRGLAAGDIKALVARLRRALCLSNDEVAYLSAILARRVDLLERFEALGKAGQKRLASSRGFDWALALVRAEDGPKATRIAARVEELSGERGGLMPERWVTGEDLILLGMKPGPDFARILETLYDRQLEGSVADRAGLLEHLATLDVRIRGPLGDDGERP